MYDLKDFHTGKAKLQDHLKTELGALRTGGASPQLLDSVKVDAYGASMKITELAAISVSDPTLLVISPWDTSLVGAIEKGIQQAGINLNPIVDGKIIRISVPPLTQEARQNLVKILNQKIEEVKVMLRTLRGEIKKNIEKQKGQAGISEDNIKADLENLEVEVKKMISEIDQLASEKQQALLKV